MKSTSGDVTFPFQLHGLEFAETGEAELDERTHDTIVRHNITSGMVRRRQASMPSVNETKIPVSLYIESCFPITRQTISRGNAAMMVL